MAAATETAPMTIPTAAATEIKIVKVIFFYWCSAYWSDSILGYGSTNKNSNDGNSSASKALRSMSNTLAS